MRILTLDNQSFDLDHLPEEVDDMRFAILDNSTPADPDYHYIPLIFLESFNAPALVLRIGNKKIKMPVDWQILIGEPDLGDLEVLPLTSINDRGFKAFQFNPLSSFRPSFPDIEIIGWLLPPEFNPYPIAEPDALVSSSGILPPYENLTCEASKVKVADAVLIIVNV
jgi:hypothetical protein